MLEGPSRLALVPGEVIVKRKVVAGEPMAASEAQLGRLQLGPVAQERSGGEALYRIEETAIAELTPQDAEARTLAVVEELRARPEVEYAQPNYIVEIAASPTDPHFESQWHFFDNGSEVGRSPGGISLQKAWDQNTGSPSVVVAVIDTGILPDHEDIAGSPALVPGYDMITSSHRANDGGGRDDDPTDPGDAVFANECGPGRPARPSSWHGTHVSGTVGVVRTGNGVGVAGVNWNAKVQSVRVLGRCGGTTADINDAIRWAAGLPVPSVPANANQAKVINLSLGGPAPCSSSPASQAAIDDAVNAGATVVVAENEAQVAKLVAQKANLPNLTMVISIDGESGHDGWVISGAELEAKGKAHTEANPEEFDAIIDRTKAEQLCTLIYTSGTTGRPKGVELIHDCWLYVYE
ncbi:MAG: S8 family serine peptidase, partial [Actinomycetia bacterium]|nr:S8 family serine peptidase [Actinomycetes bacterium]